MIFIFAMVLATQLSRLSPLALSRVKISASFERWLSHVPIAILAALVVPEFFGHGPMGAPIWNPLFLYTAALCLVVGGFSKNLLLTTFTGMVFVAVARGFFSM